MTTACAAGHYCPTGTVSATSHPCPYGTYSDSTSLISMGDCTICPKGFTCAMGCTSNSFSDCTVGNYCPAGTYNASDVPCPGGTYSDVAKLSRVTQCIQCLPGSYCSGGGPSVSGPCTAGYVCPPGSVIPTQYPCPAGTFSSDTDLFDLSQCTPCPPGSYCPLASTSITSCPAGTYASAYNTQSPGPGIYPSCLPCTAGSYCTLNSPEALPCGVGYYSPPLSASCYLCPSGHYCG